MSVEALHQRGAAWWREARLRALGVASETGATESGESTLVAAVPRERQEAVLRAVAAGSEQAGAAIARELGRPYTVAEVAEFLGQAGVPCFSGKWASENHLLSRYHHNAACRDVPLLFCCDYWREAAAGVARGLNAEVRFSRHRSIGHGDDECFDYVFQWPHIDRRHGVVPAFLRTLVTRALAEMNVSPGRLLVEGYCERTLFLTLDGKPQPAVIEELCKRLHDKVPGIRIVDTRTGESRR